MREFPQQRFCPRIGVDREPDVRTGQGMGSERSSALIDEGLSRLMAAAQAGDRSSYEALLRGCTPIIRRIARGRGVQGDRLDDVVQEVLLTLHRARQTYDPSRSFMAWMSTIAQRRAIDALRRRTRQDRREVHDPDAYEAHADPRAGQDGGEAFGVEEGRIEQILATLPAGQREALEALALRQLSLDEAAVVTGKSKGALKVNMHRALKSLRIRFGAAE